jgi:hypothetical protein
MRDIERMKCALTLALALLAPGAGWAVPFKLSLDTDSLAVTGVSAGAKVAFFGISRDVDPDDVATIRRTAEVVGDDDGDGTVALKLGRPVALRSVWIAVDLGSGDSDAAAPEGFRLKKVNFHGRGLTARSAGRDAIEEGRPLVELLVARPGVGVWTARLGDGGPGDEDGAADGKLAAALDRMEPLGGTRMPAPAQFEKDDVVVLIDPNALEMTLVKVGAKL